jgi:hypothetical protein
MKDIEFPAVEPCEIGSLSEDAETDTSVELESEKL